MTAPPGLEGIPLCSSLVSSCGRSSATLQYRDSQNQEKDRDSGQAEKDKELRGAMGGQAGGPLRTRIRKTSRANLFMGKPHGDANKHGLHGSGLSSGKAAGNGSSSTVVSSTPPPVNPLHSVTPTQESVASPPPPGESYSVTVMPELLQTAAKVTTTCPSTDSSDIDSAVVNMESDICNHLNHSSSSVKDTTTTTTTSSDSSSSSHNASAGMPC